MGGLAKKWIVNRGFNFSELNCLLVFSFLNLARLYGCIILTVLSCLNYYIGSLHFRNLTMDKYITIYLCTKFFML